MLLSNFDQSTTSTILEQNGHPVVSSLQLMSVHDLNSNLTLILPIKKCLNNDKSTNAQRMN